MIGEVTAKVVEVAGKIGGEVAKETAKETGKAAAKGLEKGIDISKRLDTSKKVVDIKATSIDITKRIVPEGSGVIGNAKELTPRQTKELISKGMSPGIIKDIRYDDGIYRLKTVNDALAGKKHPEAGVKYEKKIVDLFGKKIEGVFPKFDAIFTTTLPADKLIATDKVQFDYCNAQLKKEISSNPSLKNKFSKRQLDQISKGKNPSGFTWNHNEELGKMELVDTIKHDLAKHTGGKALWSGGKAFR